MEFLDQIFNQRENIISDNSKKLYVRNLLKLNDNKKIKYLKFLKYLDEVID